MQWLEIKKQEKEAKGVKEEDLARAVKSLPAISAFAKVLEISQHNQALLQKIEQALQRPSSSDEEEIGKEFLRLAKRAFEKNISLEAAGKRVLRTLIS